MPTNFNQIRKRDKALSIQKTITRRLIKNAATPQAKPLIVQPSNFVVTGGVTSSDDTTETTDDRDTFSVVLPIGTPLIVGPVNQSVVRLPGKRGSAINWLLKSAVLRAEVAGTTSTVVDVESSTAGGAFSASSEGTLTLAASDYEDSNDFGEPTLPSGTLLRPNVTTLALDVQFLSLYLEFVQA